MRMCAIFNRRPDRAVQAFEYAGSGRAEVASSQSELDDALRRELPAVAEEPFLICRSSEIDVVVDVTGSVEFGAQVALEAFAHGSRSCC